MDPALYTAAYQGSVQTLKVLLEKHPKILDSVTPQGNTALHIAAWRGHYVFAEETLRHRNALLVSTNAENETPLHVAAKAGHFTIADMLVNYGFKWQKEIDKPEERPLMMANKQGDTPLHVAVRHRNYEVAMKLLKADPTVRHMRNHENQLPLHIAAREGLVGVVREILQHSSEEGPEEPPQRTRSPLHQAILGGHIRVVEILLNKRKDLIKYVDESGNNALHCAAQRKNGRIVEILLKADCSLAYATNLDGQSPLHVAAANGSVIAIKELMKHCPDTAEQLDGSGKNALHIAVEKGTVDSLKCLLKNIKSEEIINQVDTGGNTPLHLAAQQARIKSALLLLEDKRVNPYIVNVDGLTARGVIESLDNIDTYEMYIWRALKKREKQIGKKQQYAEASISRSFRKKLSTTDEHFKSSAETYTLVAALIATVTFAATFTVPGGYNQENGKAILAKHPAFKAFMISNTIAMCSSLIVVFCFIWAWKDPVQFKINQLKWGHRLTVVACLAMLVALTTAVFQVVAEECLWLAIMICLICCSAPFIVGAILGYEVLFIPL